MTGVRIRRENRDTDTHRGECHVKTEVEEQYLCKSRDAKDCGKPQEARGEAWNRLSLKASSRNQPC